MTVSQSAASNVVPLLARLVLAIAFIPMGWNKIMNHWTPTPEEVVRLQVLGVLPTPLSAGEPAIIRAAFQTEGVSETVATPPVEPDGTATAPTTAPEKPVIAPPTTVASPSVRELHHITLMLDGAGFSQYAVYGAWAAALTELIGGGLLLVGLFARLWGLGLAIAMMAAFYLTSLEIVQRTWFFSATHDETHQVVVQLALFVLAWGLVMTGAGALSLDRALFGGSEPPPAPKPAA